MKANPENQMPDEDLADAIAGDVTAAKAQQEIEQLQVRLQEAEDRALRIQAESENIRKRLRREMDEERRYAHLGLLRELLPAIDNFQRALASMPDGADPGLVNGIRMVAKQVIDTFQKNHCIPIEEINVPFDPTIHEAVEQSPSDSIPAGSVMAIKQAGYRLHERVVRPAYVAVSTGPEKLHANL